MLKQQHLFFDILRSFLKRKRKLPTYVAVILYDN